jgi:hypothetical protein
MNIKFLLLLPIFLFAVYFTVSAKTATKKQKSYFRLIEAYTQKTIPGIPGAQPKTAYHFIITWQAPKYPQTFFWRGENGWLPCKMSRAHRHGTDYVTENIDEVHKGDTLELVPVSGGKFLIPAEIPVAARNTLFFKTGGSGWLAFPVKNIGKRDDILMR